MFGLPGGMPPRHSKKHDHVGIPVDAPTVALQSGNKKGIAAFFSKHRSDPSSMASTSAGSTASSSQRIAQPLAGSEFDVVAEQAVEKSVEEKSSPSSVDPATVNSYDSMSL